jgi:catechol 2,3-dioxygenase-like lactoylglutathione lyase family enzyme
MERGCGAKPGKGGSWMRIKVTSVFVDDQEKALRFYTEVLGFVKKRDLPAGGARWLTVVSPEGPDDLEVLLEPNWNPAVQINGRPAAAVFQRTLYEAGIPCTVFYVENLQKECERLKKRGVTFAVEPVKTEGGYQAVIDDTCGNLIMLFQEEVSG